MINLVPLGPFDIDMHTHPRKKDMGVEGREIRGRVEGRGVGVREKGVIFGDTGRTDTFKSMQVIYLLIFLYS